LRQPDLVLSQIKAVLIGLVKSPYLGVGDGDARPDFLVQQLLHADLPPQHRFQIGR
jgi:hypothetical protein